MGHISGAISGCLSINHKPGELLGSTMDVLLKYGLGYCLNKYAPFQNSYAKILLFRADDELCECLPLET